jgi:tetratricopeptide (TPR) repeat protein
MGLTYSGTALGAQEVEARCEEQWITESANYVSNENQDYPGLLRRWKQLATSCPNSVVYQARLADIYFYLDDPDEAKKALAPVAEQRNSPYYELVVFASLLADLKQKTLHHQVTDESAMRGIIRGFDAFVKQYPHFTEGYAMLGGLQVLDRDYKSAIENLETAESRSDMTHSKAGIYRNLTIAYEQSGLYEKAYVAAGKAYAARKSVTSDKQFVYSYARAAAGTGKLAEADTAIRVILAKYPELKSDREFAAALNFVVMKEKASQAP